MSLAQNTNYVEQKLYKNKNIKKKKDVCIAKEESKFVCIVS